MSGIGSNAEITDIIIEPELQMVRFFISGSSACRRIPWCYLADTIPSAVENYAFIVGETYGQWAICATKYRI